jgi:adenylate cyclase
MMTRTSVQFESFTLDLDRLCLRGPSGQVGMRRKSFDVLRYLVEHAGRVVTKEEIVSAVWPDVTVGEESLTQCVSEIRRALEDERQRIIRTVPRRGYLVDVPTSEHDMAAVQTRTDAGSSLESSSPGLPLPDRASIAVLPLAILGHDPQLEYFADGIVEDIITDLSRFSELFVIARNSSFQYKGKLTDVRQVGRALGVHYVLQGSIRRCGAGVRVSLQLVDAQTGAHRWAERYDRQIDEVFQVQDQVTHSVAAILAAHLSKAEAERTALKLPATWQAYDYYRRAADAYADFHRTMEVASIYKARAFIGQCIAVDPNFARANVLLSQTRLSTWAIPLDDDFHNPAALDTAYRAAEKAVQRDANLPQARYQLGLSLSFKRQVEAAVAECERGVALNPSYTDARFIQVLVSAGQYERAVNVGEAHWRVDPFTLPVARGWLGRAYYMLRRYPEAVARLREFVLQAPNHPGRKWLVAAYAQTGRIEEARAEVTDVLRSHPSLSCELGKPFYLLDKDAHHLLEGLRKVGFPKIRE